MGGIHLTQIADHEVEGTPEHVVSPMRHPTQGEKGNGTAVGIAVCEVGIHSFRHTWVTRSAEDGVDSITIREVVGWGSPAMKRVYTHVSQEHVRSQMDKRTSKAFPSPEEHPAIPVAAGAADVGSMDTDGSRNWPEGWRLNWPTPGTTPSRPAMPKARREYFRPCIAGGRGGDT